MLLTERHPIYPTERLVLGLGELQAIPELDAKPTHREQITHNLHPEFTGSVLHRNSAHLKRSDHSVHRPSDHEPVRNQVTCCIVHTEIYIKGTIYRDIRGGTTDSKARPKRSTRHPLKLDDYVE